MSTNPGTWLDRFFIAESSVALPFQQPAVNATVTVQLLETGWMAVGNFYFITGGGSYVVTSIANDGVSVTLQNIPATGNAAPGATIPSGATVAVSGPPGQSAPAVTTVANPAAANALSTAGFTPYATTIGILSLQAAFLYCPGDVGTPDNIIRVAAQGGGNWVSIFSTLNPGVLGQSTGSLSSIKNFLTEFAVVAAGQTSTIYTLDTPNLGTGEQVSLFVDVDIQSAATPVLVTGCTGNGVSPIVLTVSSTSALQTGSMVGVSGVGGNTAANGGFICTVVDGTHVSLNGTTGNGAYTSGGSLLPADFGHFKREIVVRNVGGNLVVNAQGTTSDTDLTIPASPSNEGSSLSGTLCQIVVSGTTLAVQITAPAATPVSAAVVGTWVRRPIANGGALPSITSASQTHGPATGGTEATPVTGTITLTGANFTGAFACTFGGVSASFVVNSPGQITVTPPNSHFVDGAVPIVVVTPAGSSNTSVTWTYDVDPTTVFGGPFTSSGHLTGWWDPSTIQQTSGSFTSWTGKSGSGESAFSAVGGTITYNASSSANSSLPSVSTDGSATELHIGTFTHGAVGDPMFLLMVCKVLGGGSNANGQVWIFVSTGGQQVRIFGSGHGSTVEMLPQNGTAAVWGSNIVGAVKALYGYSDGIVSATSAGYINVDNGTEVDSTGNVATALAAAGTLDVGGTGGFGLVALEVSEIIAANVRPSSTQRSKLQTYLAAKYPGLT